MTYILGANCIDGVVLVADRKVTFKENRSTIDYRRKYYPIVVGCAGSTVISDQFGEDMLIIAMEYQGKITLDKFIPQLTSKIKEIKSCIEGFSNKVFSSCVQLFSQVSVVLPKAVSILYD
jgi:hypothetical protein